MVQEQENSVPLVLIEFTRELKGCLVIIGRSEDLFCGWVGVINDIYLFLYWSFIFAGMLNKLMDMNDVQITVKPKLKQCCKVSLSESF